MNCFQCNFLPHKRLNLFFPIRVENAFLVSLIGARPEKYFWIGLSNQRDLHTFEWTNTKEVSYTHFNAGMPGTVLNVNEIIMFLISQYYILQNLFFCLKKIRKKTRLCCHDDWTCCWALGCAQLLK